MVEFPDSMTEAQINAAATRLYKGANPGAKQPPVTSWTDSDSVAKAAPGSNTGLAVAASGRAIPAAAAGAMELATNPAVPRVAAKIGKVAGGLAPVVGGFGAGGPIGGLAGVGAAAKGAWAGGKTGWFTGKLAQSLASPVASALEKVSPYAQALSTFGGVQSALDLAQMAEPNRQDIGVLGVGKSVTVPTADDLVKMPLKDAIQAMVSLGVPLAKATRDVINLRARSGVR